MNLAQVFKSKKSKKYKPLTECPKEVIARGSRNEENTKKGNGQLTQIPNKNSLETGQGNVSHGRYTDGMKTIRFDWHIGQYKRGGIPGLTNVERLDNSGEIALAVTRSHHRRCAQWECAMIGDIKLLRYIMLVQTMKFSGFI